MLLLNLAVIVAGVSITVLTVFRAKSRAAEKNDEEPESELPQLSGNTDDKSNGKRTRGLTDIDGMMELAKMEFSVGGPSGFEQHKQKPIEHQQQQHQQLQQQQLQNPTAPQPWQSNPLYRSNDESESI